MWTKLWNDVIDKEEKDIQSYSLFQRKIKSKLIETENKQNKTKLIIFDEMLIILKSTNMISVYC